MLDSQLIGRVADLTAALTKMQDRRRVLSNDVQNWKRQSDEAEHALKWEVADFARKKYYELESQLNAVDQQIASYQKTLAEAQSRLAMEPSATSQIKKVDQSIRTRTEHLTQSFKRSSENNSSENHVPVTEVLRIVEEIETDLARMSVLSKGILEKISKLKLHIQGESAKSSSCATAQNEVSDLMKLIEEL
jgi:chromosome segregation ATPase